MERSLNAEIILHAKHGGDTSIFQLLAASNFCKNAINSIYPEAQSPHGNRKGAQSNLFPSGQIYYPENLDGIINILSTLTSDINLQGWKPNHFVPCSQGSYSVQKKCPLKETQSLCLQKMKGNWRLKHNLEMTNNLKTMEGKNRQQRSHVWKLSLTLVAKCLRNLT